MQIISYICLMFTMYLLYLVKRKKSSFLLYSGICLSLTFPLFHCHAIFEKGYCLYRQNKLEAALESLKGQEGSTESMLLESQILYRLGKIGASVDIYQKLPKSTIDSLEINLVAGMVSAGRSSEVQGTLDSLRVKATSSFELAYNTACSLIEREKYKDAEQLLLSARRQVCL